MQGGSAASGVGHGVRAHALTPTSPHQRPGRGPRSNRVRSARLAWNRVCADRTPAMLYSNAIRIQLHAIGCMRDRRGAVLDAGLGTATVCARRSPQSPGRRQLGHGHGPLRPPLTRTRSSRLLVWACHCQSRWPPSELTRTRKPASLRVALPPVGPAGERRGGASAEAPAITVRVVLPQNDCGSRVRVPSTGSSSRRRSGPPPSRAHPNPSRSLLEVYLDQES